MITGAPGAAYVTQDGKDADEYEGHIANIHDGTTIGFKYFDFKDVKKITLPIRGYGWGGKIQVKTEKYGKVLAEIKLHNTNIWFDYSSEIAFPNGKQSLYLTYEGGGSVMLKSVKFD